MNRNIAKIWEVIGVCRYEPHTKSNFEKVELELRRIVMDMTTAEKQKIPEPKPFKVDGSLVTAEEQAFIDEANRKLAEQKVCSLENPERCEACE